MGNKKIKVAMITNQFDITGIGTVMMNYCKALNKDKYDLTILAGQPIAEKYEKECKENEINLVALPSRRREPKKHYVALWRKLKSGEYDIIHDHGNSSMMAVELTIAKMAGIRKRIAHSHNSTCSNMKIHKILNPYFRTTYTKALACGALAGTWLFGKRKFDVLPNGIQTEKFAFSGESRVIIRNKLNIRNKFVIGHMGRINEQKNQVYLLDVFEKVASVRDDVILLIVGTGPDEEKIKLCVQKHPYKSRIILYGETDNPTDFYSAMDVFVFPSKFEGLPVELLEAQISGLPCIVSDKITQEVNLGDIKWQCIDDSPKQWANIILEMKCRTRDERILYREKHSKEIQNYDISQTVKRLDRIYTNLMKTK